MALAEDPGERGTVMALTEDPGEPGTVMTEDAGEGPW